MEFKDVMILSILMLFVNTYFYNTLLLIGVLFLYAIVFNFRFFLKNKIKTLVALSFLGLLNLFWFIIPLFMSFFSGKSPGQSVAFFSDGSAKAVLDISSAQITYFSPFMFSNSYIPDPKHSAEFFARPYIVLAAFLLAISVFFLIFLYKKEEAKRDRKTVLFLSVIFLIFFAFSLGTKPPFGNIFLLFWNYLPGFSIFRSIFKFQFVIHFSFLILLIFALKKTGKLNLFRFILLFAVLVMSSCYFINPIYNQLTPPFKIPDYYFQNEFDLENKKLINTYKIFSDRYFGSPFIYTTFEWNPNNWDSANVLRFFTKQNTVFTPFSAKIIDKNIQEQLCNKEFGTSRSIPEVVKMMGILNIKNLIMQNDIKYNNSSCFDKIDGLEKESEGKLDIYTISNNDFLPQFYAPHDIISLERSGVDGILRVVSQQDYRTSSAIYIKKQNTGERDILKQAQDNKNTPPVLEFKKIDPTKFRIRVHGAKGAFPLVFSEGFHADWKAYLTKIPNSKFQISNMEGYKILDGNEEDQATRDELGDYVKNGWVTALGNLKEKTVKHRKWENEKEKLDYIEKYKIDYISKNFQGTIQNDNLPDKNIFETWLKNPIDDKNHLQANGYANSWIIDADSLCKSRPENCTKNSDGSYDFEMVVEFWPQRLLYIGFIISGLTLFSGLFYLVWDYKKKYAIKKYEAKKDEK
jgi:hypothetical protein